MRGKNCSVYTCCNTSRQKPNLRWFMVPTNRERALQWARLINRKDWEEDITRSKGKVVCEEHFLETDFDYNASKKVLKSTAVPTINCTRDVDSRNVETRDKSVQTRSRVDDVISDSYCITSTDEPFKLKETYKTFLENIPNGGAVSTSLKHNSTFKYFCTKLLKTHPVSYVFFQKTLSFLPIKRILPNLYAPATNADGILMRILKAKVDLMTEQQKYCSVAIKSFDVRPRLYYNITADKIIGLCEVEGKQSPDICTRVWAIAAQGLFEDWKQPVTQAFVTLDFDVDTWLRNVVSTLIGLGLDVRAIIQDHNSPQIFKQSTDHIVINNKKVYCIYDVPNLLVILRSIFFLNQFSFGNKVAKWNDISDLIELEQYKSYKLLPEFPNYVLNYVQIDDVDIQLAAQTFSVPVGKALVFYSDKRLCWTAAQTSEFILNISQLFDLLNSSNNKNKGVGKRGKPFSGETEQVQFLNSMLELFNDMRIGHARKEVIKSWKDYMNCFCVTITSIISLQQDLSVDYPYIEIYTSRLNLDFMRSLFSNILQTKKGDDKMPTCNDMAKVFQKLFTKNLLKTVDVNKYDLCDLTVLAYDCCSNLEVFTATNEEDYEISKVILVETATYRSCDSSNLNIVAAQILNIILKTHQQCSAFTSLFDDVDTPDKMVHFPVFLSMIVNLDELCMKTMLEDDLSDGVFKKIFLKSSELANCMLCPCFPIVYVKKLFIRFRIFVTLKYNNKVLPRRKNLVRNKLLNPWMLSRSDSVSKLADSSNVSLNTNTISEKTITSEDDDGDIAEDSM